MSTPTHELKVIQFNTAELTQFHQNPRIGDLPAIAKSLETNGQYRPVVVNLGTKTGRALEVLAGNHTLAAARHLGWETVAGSTLDVDDIAAARIVAADNRTADRGSYDEVILAFLLEDLPDLTGTGFTSKFLDDLQADLMAADLPDPIPMVTDFGKGETSELIPMKIGRYQINLTNREWAEFQAAHALFVDATGSDAGFVGFILGGTE